MATNTRFKDSAGISGMISRLRAMIRERKDEAHQEHNIDQSLDTPGIQRIRANETWIEGVLDDLHLALDEVFERLTGLCYGCKSRPREDGSCICDDEDNLDIMTTPIYESDCEGQCPEHRVWGCFYPQCDGGLVKAFESPFTDDRIPFLAFCRQHSDLWQSKDRQQMLSILHEVNKAMPDIQMHLLLIESFRDAREVMQ